MDFSEPMKRVHVSFPAGSYRILQDLAARTHRSISALVRETVEEHLVRDIRARENEQALTRLCDGDAPVNDWDTMEREIERRWVPGP